MKSKHQSSEIHEVIGSMMPVVTYPMLIDFLSEYQILSKPKKSSRSFRWFKVFSRDEENSNFSFEIADDSQMIYICRPNSAPLLFRHHPEAFAIVLSTEKSIPSWVKEYEDSAIFCCQEMTLSYFAFLLQQYFVQLLIWENQLDRLRDQKASLGELLNIASSPITNFISASDKYLSLLAYTKNRKPPDSITEQLVSMGCLPHEMSTIQNRYFFRNEIIELEETPESPYKKLLAPLVVKGSYFGSVLMVCDEQPPTEGLKDIFTSLQKRLAEACVGLWKRQLAIESPHHIFLSKLLADNQLSDGYVYNQMRLTKIPDNPQLKLIVIELESLEKSESLSGVQASVNRINKGACYYFYHNNDLLVLCYEQEGDAELSHAKSINELKDLIYKPFGLSCGVSQIFEKITDLDMAYKQAKLTLGFKKTIINELTATGERSNEGVFLFEECLIYYLVSNKTRDERFLEFSFSRSLIDKIYREDQINGTNYVALFWLYLNSGNNATLVAQRLHVHRNTVLYQINKIQQRFDFDLNVPSAKEKMLLDFKLFFLKMNHDSPESIFED